MGETQILRPAVFLDRDGVLNQDSGYVGDPRHVVLLPGVPEALNQLKSRGYVLVVVTNQSGVARGYYGEADVQACNRALASLIIQAGGPAFDLILYCPHHPDGIVPTYKMQCTCRKPQPGLILAAAKQLPIDLGRSYMVGDKPDDIESAVRAQVNGIQIAASERPAHPKALAVVASLAEAASLILQ